MPDDISLQILSQTSDNIQKLFDLSTRIDERAKAIRDKQDVLDLHCTRLEERQNEVAKELANIDKRLSIVEGKTSTSQDRWNKIFTFAIQIVWVILAAYLLMKLGIQSPSVP